MSKHINNKVYGRFAHVAREAPIYLIVYKLGFGLAGIYTDFTPLHLWPLLDTKTGKAKKLQQRKTHVTKDSHVVWPWNMA